MSHLKLSNRPYEAPKDFTAVDYPISDIELGMVLRFIFHGFNATYEAVKNCPVYLSMAGSQ